MTNGTAESAQTFHEDHIEPTLTEAEIQVRIPVWTALAQLFSDNTMQQADFNATATLLQSHQLDAAAARHILVHEVAPVFYEQLAEKEAHGEGWSAAEVESMVRGYLANSESRRRWLRVQAGRMSRRVMLGGWDAVERRMTSSSQTQP